MPLYNFLILLYGFVVKIVALRKTKAKQWVNGRKNWQTHLTQKINKLQSNNLIWIHCASYGEFEQGRPLIESIKKNHLSYKLVLTFFSPSGYEAFKNWQGADIICYLPLDTKTNVSQFLEIVKPQHAIFIKYEFWLNFLKALKQKNIPTYLVSAVFKPHHLFFRWYGAIFRKSLQTFTTLFVQDANSAQLLESINIKNYQISGDTRFDRVIEIKENFTENELIKNFKGTNKLIIAGSTYSKDEDLLLEAYIKLNNKNIKLILVPHEVNEKTINEVVLKVSNYNLSYDLYTNTQINNANSVLIINTTGILSKIYYYANCVYIGGGFNNGLHNTIEPAVFGKPITFYGDDYLKYNEAKDLVELEVAKAVNSSDELMEAFKFFMSEDFKCKEAEENLNKYFLKNSKSTNNILKSIKF